MTFRRWLWANRRWLLIRLIPEALAVAIILVLANLAPTIVAAYESRLPQAAPLVEMLLGWLP